eukprot:Seg2259.6 transcript_id=Seg2259.6/GoldUCD/mRNA.D3Y31 product="Ankyrin repeat domain-containing protein SOWAHC" protein_id=Seg2259.6/GoldUCD/D3Y31
MNKTLRIEDGLGNLDRILPNRANSFSLGRRTSRASNLGRRESNLSSLSVNSARSPLPLDASEKQWFLASSQCKFDKLKELLSVEATFINKKDFFTSALHWAAKTGKSELLHWLCDSGADVNLRTGYTPLHLAVMHCRALIVDILITDYEADINARDYSGRKPGHYAQSDMPTWVQRALRTNQGSTDGAKLDALVMSTTANLAAIKGRPLSRSWSSFRHENHDENKTAVDQKDSGIRSRTKSMLRSFRKLRNKDRMQQSREPISRQREREAKVKLRSESRSRSVPDICLTPRTKKKILQIEHPHFDEEKKPLKMGDEHKGVPKIEVEQNSTSNVFTFDHNRGSPVSGSSSPDHAERNPAKVNGHVRSCNPARNDHMELSPAASNRRVRSCSPARSDHMDQTKARVNERSRSVSPSAYVNESDHVNRSPARTNGHVRTGSPNHRDHVQRAPHKMNGKVRSESPARDSNRVEHIERSAVKVNGHVENGHYQKNDDMMTANDVGSEHVRGNRQQNTQNGPSTINDIARTNRGNAYATRGNISNGAKESLIDSNGNQWKVTTVV